MALNEERKAELRDLLKQGINLDVMLGIPELGSRFEGFVTKHRAPQQLEFYQEVLLYKEESADKDIDEIMKVAHRMVAKYMRQGSDEEINISAALRVSVYKTLGLSEKSYGDEVEEDEEYQVEIIEDFSDSEDEFGDLTREMEVVNEEKEETEVTKESLLVVFDEAWSEIQRLIDANFMAGFGQEMLNARWLRDESILYWKYQGFVSVQKLRVYLAASEIQIKYFSNFFFVKREMIGNMMKILGRNFEYRSQAINLVNNLLVQIKFPELANIAATFDACFQLRRTALVKYFGEAPSYFEDRAKALRLFREDFQKKKETINLLSASTFKKLEKKYVALSKLVADERKSTKKKVKALDSLKKLEAKQTETMENSFAQLERFEREKVYQLYEISNTMKSREQQFLSYLEQVSKGFEKKTESDFNFEVAVNHFLYRNPSGLKLDKVDPLEGKIDFSRDSFEFFYGVVEDFRRMVEEYIRSNYKRMNDLMYNYLVHAKKFVGISKKLESDVAKLKGIAVSDDISPLMEFLRLMMTDSGLYFLFESQEDFIENKYKKEIEKNLDILFKKLLRLQQTVSDRMQDTDQLAYEKLYDKYIELTRGNMDCMEYRIAKTSIVKFTEEIKRDPENVEKLITRRAKAEQKVKDKEPRVKRLIKIRADLLKRKQRLLMETFNRTVKPCIKALRYMNKEVELDSIGKIREKWDRMSCTVDSLECSSWLGSKFVNVPDEVISAAEALS